MVRHILNIAGNRYNSKKFINCIIKNLRFKNKKKLKNEDIKNW